jgi:hypothetical protein
MAARHKGSCIACRDVVGAEGTVETTAERFSRGGGQMTRPVLVVRGGGSMAGVGGETWSTGVLGGGVVAVVAAAGGVRGLPRFPAAAGGLAGAARGGLDSRVSVKRKSRRREECNGVSADGVAI